MEVEADTTEDYRLLKAIQNQLKEPSEVTEEILQNCFDVLCSIKPCHKSTSVNEPEDESSDSRKHKNKPVNKLFSSVWFCFLKYELPENLLKQVLSVLNRNILPYLRNPCLLTDLLTNAYNKGGIFSLLALNGLFFMMEKYNLEYPDFFVKLYALVNKDIINGKYSSRFFYLADLFLSSTHLPAHIVAAFAKKLSRVSLISSSNNILKILTLISNLLVNHPSLGVLIHRPDAEEYTEDPFCSDAKDPAKSNALKSSLWEIKTLESHINPQVCCKAKLLTRSFPKVESAISEVANLSFDDLYKRFRKRKFTEVPLAIHRPVYNSKSSQQQ